MLRNPKVLKNKKYWMLGLYCVLMAASYWVRINADAPKAASGKKFVTVQVGGGPPVKIAYKEFEEPSDKNTLPVILVHGSPGSAEAFDGLAKLISDRHVIAVDLPGFGDSDKTIPNYSMSAHAKYLNAFLKKKGIKRAHLVGFSLGGGVIIEAAKLEPELAGSETLISSIGVQEYELFGDYYVNHAVHGLQLGFFWMLKELTPNFGLFDGGVIEYARNFYDTDQRPLRKILSTTDLPFLILHGKDDPLVPVEAARENARLVPQSEYRELNDNHFYVFMRPEKVSGTLKDFWTRVENDTAERRRDAKPERIRAATQPFVYKVIPAQGPLIFCFFLLLFGLAFVNEDFASIFAGVFVAQGRFGFLLPVIAIIFAITVSSLAWRRIGRRRRGNAPGFIPASLEKRGSGLFGFRFQDYIRRSRDPFFRYFGWSVGVGLLRMSVIGLGVYLLTRGIVISGIVNNTSSLYLIFVSLSVFSGVALIRWRTID